MRLHGAPTDTIRCAFYFSSLAIALAASCSVYAVRHERLVDTWRPVHYSVSLSFDDKLQIISAAHVEVEVFVLKKISAVDLDFGDLTTDSVSLNSRPVPFEHSGGKLLVHLPTPVDAGTALTISIGYHGKPKDGLLMTPDKDGNPSAVGDNWPDRVHQWIPCLDHPSAKASVTFSIVAPTEDLVVANGRLVSVENTGPTIRTWTYDEHEPIPPYCMIVGVGKFSLLESPSQARFPMSYYVVRSDASFAPKGFSPAAPALNFFAGLIAPYPYEKLALIVGPTRFGGMENSSAIVFASMIFSHTDGGRVTKTFGISSGIEDVVTHEIAHQWFGDSVTESTWADLWLSEGFATYFAGLFIQRFEGEDSFQAYLKQAEETAFAYERKTRSPIFDRDTEDLFKLLNANNYQKGAWVLHMLRSRLGDEAFFNGLRSYYDTHKGSTASSEDLREALERASHTNLKEFFTRWVYDSGHPRYELSWQWIDRLKSVRVELKQTQQGNIFRDPIQLRFVGQKETREETLVPVSRVMVRMVHEQQAPLRVEVDPQNLLLKEAIVVRR